MAAGLADADGVTVDVTIGSTTQGNRTSVRIVVTITVPIGTASGYGLARPVTVGAILASLNSTMGTIDQSSSILDIDVDSVSFVQVLLS